jgi:hypothetical protein
MISTRANHVVYSIFLFGEPRSEAVPFTFHVKFPAEYKVPAHWHPVNERITVVSGTLNLGAGDTCDPGKTTALPAGSVSIRDPITNHFAWTKKEDLHANPCRL